MMAATVVLLKGQFGKCSHVQIDVSFSCLCPVIDHEFRDNIVEVAVDPQGDN